MIDRPIVNIGVGVFAIDHKRNTKVAASRNGIIPFLKCPFFVRPRHVVFDVVYFDVAPFGFVLKIELEFRQVENLAESVAEFAQPER